jgi:hypothetical protein
MDAHHKELMAIMKAGQESIEAMTEANPEELKSVAVHEEVRKEEATLTTVRALKKRYGDRHLAVGCRRNGPKAMVGPGRS